jgi:hypothetical protein
MPCVIKLGGDPDLFAGNTRVPDALAYFSFVTVGEGTKIGQSAQNFMHDEQRHIQLTCQYGGNPSTEQL